MDRVSHHLNAKVESREMGSLPIGSSANVGHTDPWTDCGLHMWLRNEEGKECRDRCK